MRYIASRLYFGFFFLEIKLFCVDYGIRILGTHTNIEADKGKDKPLFQVGNY